MQATHLTMEELESGLATLGASPDDGGVIELIVSRPRIGERLVLDHAEITTEVGLVGDTWTQRGSRHMPNNEPHPGCQLTLMNSRIVNLIAGEKDRWQWAGDQLYVDFDLSETNCPPGTRLALGSVIVEVSDVPHTGCAKFTERFGHAAIQWVNSREGRAARRRGMNTRVIQSGTIRLGDSIRKL